MNEIDFDKEYPKEDLLDFCGRFDFIDEDISWEDGKHELINKSFIDFGVDVMTSFGYFRFSNKNSRFIFDKFAVFDKFQLTYSNILPIKNSAKIINTKTIWSPKDFQKLINMFDLLK